MQMAESCSVLGIMLAMYSILPEAQERLRALGFDVRSVIVTDDIASAVSAERHQRRGIAGMLPVFQSCGCCGRCRKIHGRGVPDR